ncbi:peptidase [Pseudoalteromonas sp. S1610]|uniref:regulatory protein RecX n=1 Tax=unclassified Pseudoalteromonas TaxID=194690 RepID=UPI00110AC466|nr:MULTISPECIES: regulatory protein RecX [unclassified Pseudoalteromonas]MCK8126256.1 recombination regulator RecX [Pseudoalteromonas sp. 2CM39R]TMP60457.1 peptidase [Pseudoalteromonas sp. S1610]
MDDTLKQKLKNYVLWLLGRQEYSRRELTQKLQQREATDEFIENLLDWCEKHNFINEQRYCEGFVRKHIFKCHGLKRIQSEAMSKGINRALLETVVDELEIDWFELAQEAYNKKYSTTPADLEYKEKAKRVRYLMYRGFSYDQINFAMQAQ